MPHMSAPVIGKLCPVKHKGMKTSMHRFILLVLTLLLNGCVGLAAGTYGKHELAKESFELADTRNKFSFGNKKYSQEQVIELWGSPDRQEMSGKCTVFAYENGTSWSGAGIFLGVAPVPIAVPSGNYWNYIYFSNNQTVGAVIEYGEVKDAVGVTCGSNECESVAGNAGNSVGEDAGKAVQRWCGEGA